MNTDINPVQKPAVAFDLDLACEAECATLTVVHPVSGEATSARITIAGPTHPTRREAVFARLRRARSAFEKNGVFSMPDPLDSEDDNTALIATCTLDWTGLCTGGAALTFSAAQAERIYADPRWAWLREQVLKALDTRELFFNTEPATAATTG